MHRIEVIEGPDSGTRFDLPDGEPQLIGRSTEALPFNDRAISRRHAELTPSGGAWWLRDLRSTNGSFVNGAPVLDLVQLRPGDRIRCGDTVMRLVAAPGESRLRPGGRGGPATAASTGPDALRLAAIGETITTLSHSIKNILQGLRGGADAVELAIQQGNLERAREGWPVLARNLDRVLSLTLNMLAYAKDRPLDIDLDQPNATVREVAELLAAACRRKRIRLELDLDPDMPPIPMDATAVHQALVNLATNAVEAVPDRIGVVTIRSRFVPASAARPDDPASGADADHRAATGARCEISVQDNGPGVPPEQRPHLFAPFVSTKGQRGTGLGLAVTRKLAHQHGGEVVHEARSEGGTRMTLILPAHSADFDSERTHAPRPLPDGDVGIRFEE